MRLVDGGMIFRLGEAMAELKTFSAILEAQAAFQEEELMGGPEGAALIWTDADREYLRLHAIGKLAHPGKEA